MLVTKVPMNNQPKIRPVRRTSILGPPPPPCSARQFYADRSGLVRKRRSSTSSERLHGRCLGSPDVGADRYALVVGADLD
jgi:hypothetical protein